jgi:hypothetical protein
MALSLACGVLLTACTEVRSGEDVESSSGATATDTDATSTSTSTTTGPEMKLDVGARPDIGVGDLNCSRIDMLFVIDNSSSMAAEQAQLADAVPAFVETIQTTLPTVSDIRVGVVDTDSYPGLGTDVPIDGCPTDGSVDCDSCDFRLGGLLSKPMSAIDPQSSCGFDSGQPWMNSASPGFADEFACAAIVGTEGNQIEQQAGALVAAVSDAEQGPGGCNEGFLREDALFVVLLITDEGDDYAQPPGPQGGSMGEPDEWFASLVAAKGGEATNVVSLALIGGDPLSPDCPELNAQGEGAEPSPRLQSFVERFEVNFVGSVCRADYDSFFEDSLGTVAQGCSLFNPP